MKVRLFSVAIATSIVSATACGGDNDTPTSGSTTSSGSVDAGPAVCGQPPTPEKPAASCDVTIEAPPVEAEQHVPEGTQLTYCSNPPSSGRHYPVWAAFQEYSAPIDWPYLVHSMEHGAVVLLYKCDPPGCPEIVEQLRRVRDDAAADPVCSGQATPKRIIIAPSPTINTKVAAAAWGATYQAACVDKPTLDAFVRDHYAKGPEDFCVPGRAF